MNELQIGDQVRFFFCSASPVLDIRERDGQKEYLICHSESDSFDTFWLTPKELTPTGEKADINDPYYQNIMKKRFWFRGDDTATRLE